MFSKYKLWILNTNNKPVSYFPTEDARILFLVSLNLSLDLRGCQLWFAAPEDTRSD